MKINLQGLAMGDGWVAPYYQTGSYAPFLYLNGLIGEASVIAAESSYELYKALIDAGLYVVAADGSFNFFLNKFKLEIYTISN